MWTTSSANSSSDTFQYGEPNFLRDSLQAETSYADRYGVAGSPVPDSPRTNNALTLLLLFFLIAFTVSVSKLRTFIVRQFKNLFYPYHAESAASETSGELRFQLLLVLMNCLLLAISAWSYAVQAFGLQQLAGDYVVGIGLLSATFAAYFLLRWGLYTVVNLTLFDSKKNLHWTKFLLFITACEAVLLFPAVILLVYFNFDVQNLLYYFGFVLFLNKVLTFFQCRTIFFKQSGGFLQFILYFCALEITPLLALGGAGLMVVNTIKINF